ncbi:hypothetical protein HK104_007564 [Borealophlyctis nickersoniae]|nr:hypothetical protein HK104_007564 [Borealophlyctis nickersoniae]
MTYDGDEEYHEEDLMDIDDEQVQQQVTADIADFRRTAVSQEPVSPCASYSKVPPAPPALAQTPIPSPVRTEIKLVLVVDTNYLISHLKFLTALLHSIPVPEFLFVVPFVVLDELDGLKQHFQRKYKKIADAACERAEDGLGKGTVDLSHCARDAIGFLHKSLSVNLPGLKGQTLDEFLPGVDTSKMTNDDKILECCRYAQSHYSPHVKLLSNDKNLCVKAMIHSIAPVSNYKRTAGDFIDEARKQLGMGPAPPGRPLLPPRLATATATMPVSVPPARRKSASSQSTPAAKRRNSVSSGADERETTDSSRCSPSVERGTSHSIQVVERRTSTSLRPTSAKAASSNPAASKAVPAHSDSAKPSSSKPNSANSASSKSSKSSSSHSEKPSEEPVDEVISKSQKRKMKRDRKKALEGAGVVPMMVDMPLGPAQTLVASPAMETAYVIQDEEMHDAMDLDEPIQPENVVLPPSTQRETPRARAEAALFPVPAPSQPSPSDPIEFVSREVADLLTGGMPPTFAAMFHKHMGESWRTMVPSPPPTWTVDFVVYLLDTQWRSCFVNELPPQFKPDYLPVLRRTAKDLDRGRKRHRVYVTKGDLMKVVRAVEILVGCCGKAGFVDDERRAKALVGTFKRLLEME